MFLYCLYFFYKFFIGIQGFPGGSAVKNPPANAVNTSLIPGWEDLLEKEMATHSSNILAWEIPWAKDPGRLQSTGSQRVGHDSVTEHTACFGIYCFIMLCCFCCRTALISHMYPYSPSLLSLPSSSSIPPLQVITEHRAELPVL